MEVAHVDQEFADARRYLSALSAHDNEGLAALMAEIHRGGRAMKVLAAMAVQALDFAQLAADRLGGDVQKWLDESVMARTSPRPSGTTANSAARDDRGRLPRRTCLGGADRCPWPAYSTGSRACINVWPALTPARPPACARRR